MSVVYVTVSFLIANVRVEYFLENILSCTVITIACKLSPRCWTVKREGIHVGFSKQYGFVASTNWYSFVCRNLTERVRDTHLMHLHAVLSHYVRLYYSHDGDTSFAISIVTQYPHLLVLGIVMLFRVPVNCLCALIRCTYCCHGSIHFPLLNTAKLELVWSRCGLFWMCDWNRVGSGFWMLVQDAEASDKQLWYCVHSVSSHPPWSSSLFMPVHQYFWSHLLFCLWCLHLNGELCLKFGQFCMTACTWYFKWLPVFAHMMWKTFSGFCPDVVTCCNPGNNLRQSFTIPCTVFMRNEV